MISLLILAMALLGSAYFSATETAITSVDVLQVRKRAESGSRLSRSVLSLIQVKRKVIAAMLVGNNIALVVVSSLATSLLTAQSGHSGPELATIITTPVILIFGEILPKAFALNFNIYLLLSSWWMIRFFMIIFHPFVWITVKITAKFQPEEGRDDAYRIITREDIRSLIEKPPVTDELMSFERKRISRLLEFSSKRIKSAMIPLVDAILAPVDSSVESIYRISRESGFSRIPIYKDNPENIVGYISIIDLLNAERKASIEPLLKPAVFIPENQKITDSLQSMWNRHSIAIVIDEYGITTGIITIEDLIEEIMGDIRDEFDRPEREIQHTHLVASNYIVTGSMNVSDFNERIANIIPKGSYETIAGYIIDHLQRIPERGEKMSIRGMEVTVLEATDRRLIKILVRIKAIDTKNTID